MQNPQGGTSQEKVPGQTIGSGFCLHFPYAGCAFKIIYSDAHGGSWVFVFLSGNYSFPSNLYAPLQSLLFYVGLCDRHRLDALSRCAQVWWKAFLLERHNPVIENRDIIIFIFTVLNTPGQLGPLSLSGDKWQSQNLTLGCLTLNCVLLI